MTPKGRGVLTLVTALIMTPAWAGCGDSGGSNSTQPPAVASVRIEPALDTLFSAGASVQMSATALTGNGAPIAGAQFDWSTSDAAVASVSGSGLVLAEGPNGHVTISATTDGVTGSAPVFVASGPEGGTVVDATGTVTLTIPAGVLAGAVTVSIDPAPAVPEPERVVVGTTFDFGPDGTVFQNPAQLEIDYDEAAIPEGDGESELRLYRLEAGQWTAVEGSSVDVAANSVAGPIDGFSVYGLLGPPPAAPGRIFVDHEDWPFRSEGFDEAPDAAQFAVNLAAWFTGGGAGNLLAFSSDPGLTGSELDAAMTGAGHTWTVSTTVPFTMPGLLDYDAIFLAGTDADNQQLIDYVNAGGNVYLAGGTGSNSQLVATRWNTFLTAFGLRFASDYNELLGTYPTCSPHPTFAHVEALYFDRGSSVSEVDPSSPDTDVLQVLEGTGLFAIYDPGAGTSRAITSIEVTPAGPVSLSPAGATQDLRALAVGDPDDACSGVIPGVTFEWDSDDPDVATVDSEGTVTAVGSGSAGITASSGGVTSNIVTVEVTPAAELAFTVQPTDVAVNAAVAPPVQVSVLDGSGSVATGFVGDVTLTIGTNPGGGTLSGTTTRAAVDGVATFDDLRIDMPGTGYELQASAAGVPSATSAGFTVSSPGFLPTPRVFAAQELSCALLLDKTVWCWGDGEEGAGFGNPVAEESSVPVLAASGMLFKAFALEGHGGDQACGIDLDGQAHCWGRNFHGQLGDGTTMERMTPTPVVGGHQFVSIAPGENHTCALSTDGSAHCWGRNEDGQLGDGTETGSLSPVPVAGGHSFTTIDVGDDLSCALDPDGAAFCWGENSSGQLGNGSTVNASEPTPVAGGLTFTLIRTGRDFACALTAAGTAYCWGSEGEGKLGNGSLEDRLVPTMVAGGLTFSSLGTGVDHTCGVTTDGTGYCWGEGESLQLGHGLRTSSAVPVMVQGGIEFEEIAPGEDHTCGRATDARHYCWGSDSGGAIGDGQPLQYTSPNPVVGGLTFTHLASGCAIDPGGAIHCWGGDDGPEPTLVSQAEVFAQISGIGEVCALTTTGVAYCRGAFDPDGFEPVAAGGLTFATIDATAFSFSLGSGSTRCALTDAGDAYCWGAFNGASAPTLVPGGITWSAFSVGTDKDVCGLDDTGRALCWGPHVGNFEATPVPVGDGLTFATVDVGQGIGQRHACGLTTDGAAYCWGSNESGQLGDGTTETPPATTPVAVAGGLTFESIALASRSTCAVAAGGAAYCWGVNSSGEAGTGSVSETPITTPTAVTGGLSFAVVKPVGALTCGLTTAGDAYCWGPGGDGIGDGLGSSRAAPALVQFPGG